MRVLRAVGDAEAAALRGEFLGAALPAVLVEGALGAGGAAALRARAEAAGLAAQSLAHRGRYARDEARAEPGLFDELAALAARISGAALAVDSFRWARLARGDYVLSRDDGAGEGRALEATLDFSDVASGGAELCYCRHGRLLRALPQRPGSVALVARGPGVARYERYLNHRVGDARVYRLTLRLRAAGA